ncbi:major facilitator superfamily domain-containing protein [Dichotomocladium elegans]|nr:major facilitator superfamily domain-containing protein [Dichotomocladium elegans]
MRRFDVEVQPEKEAAALLDGEARLVRKINLVTVPLICSVFFVEYIDKVSLNYAGVLGIYQDTGITHDQFGQVGTLFYVGYLLFQLPNNYLLQKLPTSKYLGTAIFGWGIIQGFMVLATSFAQLATLRFFMGLLEAVSYPAVFLVISTLYRKKEQIVFIGLAYISTTVASFCGALISYGAGKLSVAYPEIGIAAWKWVNLFCAGLTLILGLAVFAFLPDTSLSRWFRIEAEEVAIVAARQKDNGVMKDSKVTWADVLGSLRESRFYLFFLAVTLGNLQNGCIQIFSSQMIMALGFTNLQSVLLKIPFGIFSGLVILVLMFASRRTGEILGVAMVSSALALAGGLLLVVLPQGPGQLAGIYLSPNIAILVLTQASVSANVTGYTKKIVYTSSIAIAYGLGHLLGPLLMVEREAPTFVKPLVGYMMADALAIVCLWLIRRSFQKDNDAKWSAYIKNCSNSSNGDGHASAVILYKL